MNERGFFTVVGICFLLVAALLVKGVQESERNYVYVTRDFYNESDLQNIADGALIEAMNMIDPNNVEKILPKRNLNLARSENQKKIFEEKVDENTNVEVYAEYGKYFDDNKELGNIWFVTRTYSGGKYTDSNFKKIPNTNDYLQKKGVIIISVATRETDDGKVYRRAIGYFFTDEDKENPTKIYFMNHLSDD